MDRVRCYYCNDPARYYCTCVTPNISFCRNHQIVHEGSIGDHKIILYKQESVKVNPKTKQELIQKIFQVQSDAREKTKEMLNDLSKEIIRIQEKSKCSLENLNMFIKTCDGVIQEIYSIDEIPYKNIPSPLEFILLSDDISSLITKIAPPNITYSNSLPYYTPSIFPHFLYNHSDLSIDFPSEKVIYSHPALKEISNKRLHWASRFLNIGNQRLLFTGGKISEDIQSNYCFILDVSTEEITECPPLQNARIWHSMAWVGGNPAVIGGNSISKEIESVEVLTAGKWVELSPINIPRSAHTSLNTQQEVWTIGGFRNENILDSIEKYQNNAWSIINLRLPTPLGNIGMCSLENNLLLFGGYNYDNVDSSIYINNKTLSISNLNRIQNPLRFTYNSLLVGDSKHISIVGKDSARNLKPTIYSIKEIQL